MHSLQLYSKDRVLSSHVYTDQVGTNKGEIELLRYSTLRRMSRFVIRSPPKKLHSSRGFSLYVHGKSQSRGC